MAFNTKAHDKVINNTLDDIQAGVYDNVKGLEREISVLVAQGYDVTTLRPAVISAFQKYSNQAKESVGDVTNLSNSYISQTTGQFTNDDMLAQGALAAQTQNTVANTINSMAENVLEVITLGVASGVALDVVVRQVGGRISGVLFDSDDANVRRQQRKLNKMMRSGGYTAAEYSAVVDKIRKLTPEVNSANSMRDQVKFTVEQSVMNYEGAFAAGASQRAGVEQWTYAGGVIETSRPFCQGLTGSTLDRATIDSIWGGSWAGKEPGDAFVVRGGYNCRHYWVPVQADTN